MARAHGGEIAIAHREMARARRWCFPSTGKEMAEAGEEEDACGGFVDHVKPCLKMFGHITIHSVTTIR